MQILNYNKGKVELCLKILGKIQMSVKISQINSLRQIAIFRQPLNISTKNLLLSLIWTLNKCELVFREKLSKRSSIFGLIEQDQMKNSPLVWKTNANRSSMEIVSRSRRSRCSSPPLWFIVESFASIHVHRRCTMSIQRFCCSIDYTNCDMAYVSVCKISYILEKEHRKEVMNLRFRPLCPRDLYVHATINQLTTRETSKNTVEVVFWLKPKKTVCDLSRTVCARWNVRDCFH